jgi:hypothetical protein
MKVIHYGSNKFDESKFQSIKNDNWAKPRGGLWTSPINSKYGWKDWNESEQFMACDIENSFIIELSNDCKILKIDSKIDLLKLPTYSKENSVYLDYEAITTKYDAIWLTANGENETRYCGMFDNNAKMYGWDCETVLILNNKCISDVK